MVSSKLLWSLGALLATRPVMALDVMPLYPRDNETTTDTGSESSKNSDSNSGDSGKGSNNCYPTTVTQTVNTCAGEGYPTVSTTTKTVNTCSAEGYPTVSTKTVTSCNGYPTVS